MSAEDLCFHSLIEFDGLSLLMLEQRSPAFEQNSESCVIGNHLTPVHRRPEACGMHLIRVNRHPVA